jgi:hypothetical protein
MSAGQNARAVYDQRTIDLELLGGATHHLRESYMRAHPRRFSTESGACCPGPPTPSVAAAPLRPGVSLPALKGELSPEKGRADTA